MDFEGKVVLITGAAGAIGRETSKLFAEKGANLVLVDNSKERLAILSNELKLKQEKHLLISADVSIENEVKRYINESISSFQRIDVFFNNAGVTGVPSYIKDIAEEDLDRVFNVNVKGVFFGLKYTIPEMLKQKKGSVINIASDAATTGSIGLGPYVASKHAVLGLTKTAALECAKEGVRINAVSPTSIRSNMMDILENSSVDTRQGYMEKIPMNRYGEAYEVAQVVLFLASNNASFVTGACYNVDGGRSAK